MKTKVLQMFSFFASADTALTTKLFANVTAVLNRAKHMQGNGSNAAFLYKNHKKNMHISFRNINADISQQHAKSLNVKFVNMFA